MKNLLSLAIGLIFTSLTIVGCSQPPKAVSADQAIEQSQTFSTAEEKEKYLVSQANSFVSSKEYDQAIQTAQYVLANIDSTSAEAKSILEKAAAELKEVAQEKAEEVQKTLGNLGK